MDHSGFVDHGCTAISDMVGFFRSAGMSVT